MMNSKMDHGALLLGIPSRETLVEGVGLGLILKKNSGRFEFQAEKKNFSCFNVRSVE
jgi:hypothetical protein